MRIEAAFAHFGDERGLRRKEQGRATNLCRDRGRKAEQGRLAGTCIALNDLNSIITGYQSQDRALLLVTKRETALLFQCDNRLCCHGPIEKRHAVSSSFSSCPDDCLFGLEEISGGQPVGMLGTGTAPNQHAFPNQRIDPPFDLTNGSPFFREPERRLEDIHPLKTGRPLGQMPHSSSCRVGSSQVGSSPLPGSADHQRFGPGS